MIVQGNALSLPLADSSVDLIVTSPPYFALRSYQDAGTHYAGQVGSEETPQAFLEALWEATAEMVRVLKPSGSIFVNLGDKYAGSGGHNNNGLGNSSLGHHKGGGGPHAEKMQKVEQQRRATRRNAPDAYNKDSSFYDHSSLSEWSNHPRYKTTVPAKSLMLLPHRYAIGCVDNLGLILRQDQVWAKPNGLPESVTDRTRRSHEYWFHFVKSQRYFAAMDEIREPHAPHTIEALGGFSHGKGVQRETENNWTKGEPKPRILDPRGVLPNSVWTIATEPLTVPDELGIDHFAAFPTEWPRRLILGWCPEGGVVLDPFGGTGTTAMVARALGRTGVSIDLSYDYSRLAKWRVYESGHEKKAVRRTNASKQGAML